MIALDVLTTFLRDNLPPMTLQEFSVEAINGSTVTMRDRNGTYYNMLLRDTLNVVVDGTRIASMRLLDVADDTAIFDCDGTVNKVEVGSSMHVTSNIFHIG